MKKKFLALILMVTAGFFAGRAWAQPPKSSVSSPTGALTGRTGYFILGVNGGYMFDPDMPSGMISLDYFITDEVSVGPYLHFGGGGENRYWGLSGQVRYAPPIMENPRVRPFATLGIGFIDTDFESESSDKDLTYLFPIGGGLEFELSDILAMYLGGLFEISEDSFAGVIMGITVIL